MIGGTAGTTLGGACTGACNVISGNGLDGASHGVLVTGSTGNQIDANYIGLNAAGTAAMLNGITPDGMTFNGDAIQLFNSSNNIIGRLSSTMRPAAELKKISTENSPSGSICFEDDETGNNILFNLLTGAYTATHCASGISLSGFANPATHGYVGGTFGFYTYFVYSPPGGLGEFKFKNPAPDPGLTEVLIDDSNTADSTCDCMRPGVQTIDGPIDVSGNNNDIRNLILGLRADSVTPLHIAPNTIEPVVISNGNDNKLDGLVITAYNPGITIENGTGNSIGAGIDWKIYGGLPPISILPGANGDTQAPTNLHVIRQPQDSLEITGSFAGESNTTYQVDLFPISFQIGLNDYIETWHDTHAANTGLSSFRIQSNSVGQALLDFTMSDVFFSDAFGKSAKLGAKATKVDQPSGTLRSSSAMSLPAVIPKKLFDFDNDGITDIAVDRPGLTANDVSLGYYLYSHTNSIGVHQFGIGEDKLVFGDYFGTQIPELAVWRQSSRVFYIARPTGDPSTNFDAFQWGLSTDKPQVGDFDGDGRIDLAVFRAIEGNWFIRQSLNGSLRAQNWGLAGDKLVPADYNGDGLDDLGIYRNGLWAISVCPACPARYESFGLSTDTPVPADYDGDGKADVAVWRSSTGVWYVQGSTAGFYAIQWGQNGDKPLLGDFDGDGKVDIGVWRSTDGNWYILQSSNGAFRALHWGQNGDLPIPSAEAHFH